MHISLLLVICIVASITEVAQCFRASTSSLPVYPGVSIHHLRSKFRVNARSTSSKGRNVAAKGCSSSSSGCTSATHHHKSLLEKVSEKGALIDPKMMALASVTGVTLGSSVKVMKQALSCIDKAYRVPSAGKALAAGAVALSALYAYNPDMGKTDYLHLNKKKVSGSLLDVSPKQWVTRFIAVLTSLLMGYPLGPASFMAETGVLMNNLLGRFIHDKDVAKQQQKKADLLLAGAVAGITANYNAPVAAMLYATGNTVRFLKKNIVHSHTKTTDKSPAVEHSVNARTVPLLAMAAIAAALATRRGSPLVGSAAKSAWTAVLTGSFPRTSLLEVPAYAALGAAAGLWATGYEKYKANLSKAMKSINIPKFMQPIIGSMIVWFIYQKTGQSFDAYEGMAQVPKFLSGAAYPSFWAFTLATLLYTASGLSSGAIGGPIAAFIMAGAAIGGKAHSVVSSLLPMLVGGGAAAAVVGSNLAYVAAGASALIAASTDAPLFALALILELTGRLDLAIPAMVAVFSGIGVRRALA